MPGTDILFQKTEVSSCNEFQDGSETFSRKKNVFKTQNPAENSDEQDANFNNNYFMQWSLRGRQPYTILVKTCKNNMFLK